MTREITNTPRLNKIKRQKRNAAIFKSSTFLIVCIIIFIGLVFLSRIWHIRITNVSVDGNKVVETKQIINITEQDLAGNYWFLFPKNNIFIYPKSQIKKDLAQNFKRLNNIALVLTDRNTLNVVVTEREGKYLWCGENCYFMDEDGYVFDEAPYFSGEVYFKFFGKISDKDFAKLVYVKETFSKMGLKPVTLSVLDNRDVKVGLTEEGAKNRPEIIFKMETDFNKVVENLQTALNTEPLRTDFKKKYASLLYIDLRFGNKVYYKFSTQSRPVSDGQ